ncbi:RING-H2 finger protein ATL43 [Glycine soja]
MLMPPSSFTLLLTLLLLFLTYEAESGETPPPTPPPPFRPGIAVLVCVLTTIISLTSLLLLYIKHCNGGIPDGGGGNSAPWTVAPFSGRKNSGIDRSVVESLPVFRFGALRGQKEGLDCAVCLNKFEAAEVLRLLPKCKHAFHVECVDTWLDAHSTCPLCRYRVDPEDILLVEDAKPFRQSHQQQRNKEEERVRLNLDLEKQEIVESRRRHSSVGVGEGETTEEQQQSRRWTTSFRRSLDSISATSRKKNESVGVGCFVRPRKDGMLLTQETERASVERRLEHRIIVSPGPGPGPGPGPCGLEQRWSDLQASDLLYLTSEMIMMRDSWNGRGSGV